MNQTFNILFKKTKVWIQIIESLMDKRESEHSYSLAYKIRINYLSQIETSQTGRSWSKIKWESKFNYLHLRPIIPVGKLTNGVSFSNLVSSISICGLESLSRWCRRTVCVGVCFSTICVVYLASKMACPRYGRYSVLC